MEVWTQCNPLFLPGGELVPRLFRRRVQQLALPTRPLDVARGMDSRITARSDTRRCGSRPASYRGRPSHPPVV
ncbi:hypothetical protein [Serinicoccus marinus]|uniref:hypothetical protein n=1 Tax=Serinicoccus marinus TaxID=247333 RepID=UPI0003B613DA|nr:hypothetical protein [Serinicoccus marinus]